jgi:hypothetical protein
MTKRLALLALTLTACKHSGAGPGVRDDITARMQSAQPSIASCYADRLKENRKLAGTIDVAFDVKASTGTFEQVAVTRDDMHDTALEQCVTTEVGKLKLQTPQKSNVSVPSYPLEFAPNK